MHVFNAINTKSPTDTHNDSRTPVKRYGGWIRTFSGKRFYPLDPKPEEVCIDDIASALAKVCRFTGHCRSFYSVAEHSVRVALAVRDEVHLYPEKIPADLTPNLIALEALMHDAAEAYIADLAAPIKHDLVMSDYRTAETNISNAIADAFGFKRGLSQVVHDFDKILLATEARDLLPSMEGFERCGPPLATLIRPWTWEKAAKEFTDMFYNLRDKIRNEK